MFTGLIEGLGTIKQLEQEASGLLMVVTIPQEMLQETTYGAAEIGDSVAINGCCLTVVEMDGECWSFQAGSETLSRTNLGQLEVGSTVNLERALPAHGRLGGHFVQGHVDGLGQVAEIDRDGDWIKMWFQVPPELACGMVEKGSVTVDGISLTVVDANADRFSVALIPHTLSVTTLGIRKVGDAVNIETDILGKYVAKMLATNS
ncbi:riboflavin synthase [Rubinisphaera sp.]|uniref:riboflavin synthase n=1 Tax=Rubinisphaera sp. TaxID=2024857 RepID=UPI000C119760|nr:riboflavin synthase [Rubinisphaera sp.]MBV08951.1 riboflavin synthase [Rubinisphaera sp.]HCS51739.1 riboflavin synthase [Planctomycetaceae bacterium]|tara:strand:- start:14 stop:625 length:612 start_codon:yes stop_codon:yes gene_type:complete